MCRTAGVDNEQVRELVQEQYGETATVEDVMNELNNSLHNFDFKIKRVQDQLDGRLTLHFQNLSGDPVSQMATPYPPVQIELMRKIIEWIMKCDDYQYSLTTLQIQKLSRKEMGLAPSVIESHLHSFERDGWLRQREGIWTFTNHALAELDAYLHNEYESNLYECNACREIVIAGYVCDCGYCLHVYCCKHLAHVNCLNCNTPWANATVIGRW
ncbi:RING-type E3 ubiquitin transferase [Schizosaccharomyces pombe]